MALKDNVQALTEGQSGVTFAVDSFADRLLSLTEGLDGLTFSTEKTGTASVEVLNALACVPIQDNIGTPQAPVLTFVADKDQLRVQWSKESGLPAEHTADYRFTLDDLNGIETIVINWGDGSDTETICGFGATQVVETISHTYTVSSPTITVSVTDSLGTTLSILLAQSVPISSEWCLTQFQLERYKGQPNFHIYRTRFVNDWRDFDTSKSQDDFVDFRVDRRFTWAYRVRLRQFNSCGVLVGTTVFSEFAVQDPWVT